MISWKANERGGVGGWGLIRVTTIDERKGRWGIHSFSRLCVFLVLSGES